MGMLLGPSGHRLLPGGPDHIETIHEDEPTGHGVVDELDRLPPLGARANLILTLEQEVPPGSDGRREVDDAVSDESMPVLPGAHDMTPIPTIYGICGSPIEFIWWIAYD